MDWTGRKLGACLGAMTRQELAHLYDDALARYQAACNKAYDIGLLPALKATAVFQAVVARIGDPGLIAVSNSLAPSISSMTFQVAQADQPEAVTGLTPVSPELDFAANDLALKIVDLETLVAKWVAAYKETAGASQIHIMPLPVSAPLVIPASVTPATTPGAEAVQQPLTNPVLEPAFSAEFSPMLPPPLEVDTAETLTSKETHRPVMITPPEETAPAFPPEVNLAPALAPTASAALPEGAAAALPEGAAAAPGTPSWALWLLGGVALAVLGGGAYAAFKK